MKVGVATVTPALSRRASGSRGGPPEALVHCEHFVHRRQQRLLRLAAVGGVFIAAPVAAVDVEVGIEKKRVPGGVVVELEAGQIDAVHTGDPHALEARTEGLDLFVFIGNLPIPRPALGSADAAKNDEQGLARLAGGGDAAIQVVVPAKNLLLGANCPADDERHEGRQDRE
jgi:hypothetical protein